MRYTKRTMYITVRLLNGFQKPLLYKLINIPEAQTVPPGSIVTVPLQSRHEPALILNYFHTLTEKVDFLIKEVPFRDIQFIDSRYFTFINSLSQYYGTDILHFARRLQQCSTQKESYALSPLLAELALKTTPEIILTQEQHHAYAICSQALSQQHFYPALIHGVTGSGKTELYKKLLIDCIQQQKSALFLVPEITLALQFERILLQQLPSFCTLLSYHSATSTKNKQYVWHALKTHMPVIIIGVHLPVLLPIVNLGLIIVDEEHETGYQEKKHPKINTKEAALMRAQQYGIPIILGSATPSISSLYNVHQKKYALFQFKKRFSGNFPTVRTVLLDAITKKSRPHFWISSELYTAIQDRLEHNEQVIIFLNRRGYSFFMQCKECAFTINCKQCSVSLTVHEHNKLICHYCGYTCTEPTSCPQCMNQPSSFIKKGIGTQQLVTILQNLFPSARIARADMDSSSKKTIWKQTIEDFEHKKIDLLIGTQTITKGYHFPGVTLVGIVWADLSMHMPFFNAQETTLQQLIQVAGRAGRQSEHSLVIVQTMEKHTLFDYLDEQTYLHFYKQEIQERALLGYPPCKRFVAIELKHTSEKKVDQESYTLTYFIKTYCTINAIDIQILGPTKPIIHKIKKTYTRIIYLKSDSISDCISVFKNIDQKKYVSNLFFTPNPIN